MNKSPIYDPVKRRAVVHEVLKDFLPEDIHMKALWILEDNYAKQHSLPILEYIDQIEKLCSLGDYKKALRERLTKELYFSQEIGDDPWNEMQRYKRMSKIQVRTVAPADNHIPTVSTPASTDEHSPDTQLPQPTNKSDNNGVPVLTDVTSSELVVFSHLLRELNQLFADAAGDHIKMFYGSMLSAASRLEVSPEAEANLVAWCQNNGNVIFNDIFTVEEMAKIIHTCYMWAVEYLGPDESDTLFSQAVQEVKRIPEAKAFSPTNLL